MAGGLEAQRGPSVEVLSRHLKISEIKLSPGFVAERARLIDKLTQIDKQKRTDAKRANRNLELGLAFVEGTDPVQQKQYEVLNRDEHEAYVAMSNEIIRRPKEGASAEPMETEDIAGIMLQNPQVFQTHYSEWSDEWNAHQKDPKFVEKYKTKDAYVLARGQAFIKARRADMVAARVVSTRKEKIDKISGNVTSDDLQKSPSAQAAQKFIAEHGEDLLLYSDLNPNDPQQAEKRNLIYSQFIQTCKLQSLSPVDAQKLFDGVVGDMLSFYIADKKYQAAHRKMIEIADDAEARGVAIDPDKWDQAMQAAIRENAEGVFRDSLDRADQTFKGTGEGVNVAKPLQRPQDVANLAGVVLVARGSRPDTFIVRYPDTDVFAQLRIERKPGESLDQAHFAVYDPHPDSGENNWRSLDKAHLRSGFNEVFLGSLMYSKPVTDAIGGNGGHILEEANAAFNNGVVNEAAKALYGRSLDQVFVTQQRRQAFERLLAILMKPDKGKNSQGDDLGVFAVRLKTFKDGILKDPNKVGKLQEILSKPGAMVYNLSTLTGVIQGQLAGETPKE